MIEVRLKDGTDVRIEKAMFDGLWMVYDANGDALCGHISSNVVPVVEEMLQIIKAYYDWCIDDDGDVCDRAELRRIVAEHHAMRKQFSDVYKMLTGGMGHSPMLDAAHVLTWYHNNIGERYDEWQQKELKPVMNERDALKLVLEAATSAFAEVVDALGIDRYGYMEAGGAERARLDMLKAAKVARGGWFVRAARYIEETFA